MMYEDYYEEKKSSSVMSPKGELKQFFFSKFEHKKMFIIQKSITTLNGTEENYNVVSLE